MTAVRRLVAPLLAVAAVLLLSPLAAARQAPAPRPAPAAAAPAPQRSSPASPFADWNAVVVAGDFHAHSGAPTEAFDNARRDVAAALMRQGFSSDRVAQLSVRPELYPDTRPGKVTLAAMDQALGGRPAAGCLFYFTSHGAPQGLVMDQELLAPGVLAAVLDRACGQKPTVAVISACFSGVFVPALAGPNRMVLTAARPDRSSFGCTESARYPYFDECVLQVLPKTQTLMSLAREATACVGARETAERLTPPSEPQLFVGARLRPELPLLPLQVASP